MLTQSDINILQLSYPHRQECVREYLALFAGQDGPDLGFLFDGQAAGVWILSGQELGGEKESPLPPGKLLDACAHGRTRFLGGDDLIGQISL